MKRILLVCTGNTCRSAMAEAILKNRIEKDSELAAEFSVASAGLAAFDGDTASSNAISALRELWGIDLCAHRSKSLNMKDLEEAWLILTMTREHKKGILSIVPQFEPKVFTVKEFVNNKEEEKSIEECSCSLDIPDPYGMNLQVYKSCARDIWEAADRLVQKLKLFLT